MNQRRAVFLESSMCLLFCRRGAVDANLCAQSANYAMTIHNAEDHEALQDVPGYISGAHMVFEKGSTTPSHTHRRGQLIFASSGVMECTTHDGRWLIPPQLALWMPGGIEHVMHARTEVNLRTLWIRVDDAPVHLPDGPTLIYVTPLLRELILRALEMPIGDALTGSAAHVVALILYELEFSRIGNFHVPRVAHARLRRVEEALRLDPGDTRDIPAWADLANMSPRTFARHLSAEVGMSFADWRQQIRLTEATVRLVSGEPIGSIAVSLGYENIGSFSRMFKRAMGASPSEFGKENMAASADE
jgi:AraC-like DNA-binding protein/quercetin dioxygenase-like cupin family protein